MLFPSRGCHFRKHISDCREAAGIGVRKATRAGYLRALTKGNLQRTSCTQNLHKAICAEDRDRLADLRRACEEQLAQTKSAQTAAQQQLARSTLRRELAQSNCTKQFAYGNLLAAPCSATLRSLFAKLLSHRVQHSHGYKYNTGAPTIVSFAMTMVLGAAAHGKGRPYVSLSENSRAPQYNVGSECGIIIAAVTNKFMSESKKKTVSLHLQPQGVRPFRVGAKRETRKRLAGTQRLCQGAAMRVCAT